VKKDSKNGIIIALIITLVFMSVGYAFVSDGLDNNQLTTYMSNNYKNVKITTISSVETVGEAEDVKSLISGDNELKLYPGLYNIGDEITYTVNVSNEGNVDAVLNSISVISEDNSIIYTIDNINAGDVIASDDSLMFTIKLSRDENREVEVADRIPEVILKLSF
jgi:hypothetical protein